MFLRLCHKSGCSPVTLASSTSQTTLIFQFNVVLILVLNTCHLLDKWVIVLELTRQIIIVILELLIKLFRLLRMVLVLLKQPLVFVCLLWRRVKRIDQVADRFNSLVLNITLDDLFLKSAFRCQPLSRFGHLLLVPVILHRGFFPCHSLESFCRCHRAEGTTLLQTALDWWDGWAAHVFLKQDRVSSVHEVFEVDFVSRNKLLVHVAMLKHLLLLLMLFLLLDLLLQVWVSIADEAFLFGAGSSDWRAHFNLRVHHTLRLFHAVDVLWIYSFKWWEAIRRLPFDTLLNNLASLLLSARGQEVSDRLSHQRFEFVDYYTASLLVSLVGEVTTEKVELGQPVHTSNTPVRQHDHTIISERGVKIFETVS